MLKIEKEIIKVLEKLISFQTTSDNMNEIKTCITYIEKYFKNSNLIVKRYWSNEVPSLVISNAKTKNFDLLINGHIDVVPGSKKQFLARIKNGKIFGRGAIDMKGSMAALMVLFKNLNKTNKKIGLMIVVDEEIDGSNGTKYLINNKGYKSKFSILAEESNFNIVTKQKGQVKIKLLAFGKSGHGSQPWTGNNAIEELISVYQNVRSLYPKTQKNVWNSNSINLGTINGGVAANVIPPTAKLSFDMRYPTKSKLNTYLQKLDKLIKNTGVTYSIISKTNPMICGRANCYIRKLIHIIKKETGKKITKKWTCYCSDARYFSDNNLPVIEFGPRGANYHADNEYVEIDSLVKYYDILRKFIISL